MHESSHGRVGLSCGERAGTTELKEKVLEATRSHQKSSEAEDYAVAFAVILEKVLFGATVEAALTEAQATLPASVQDAFKAARGIKSASEITQVHLPGTHSCRAGLLDASVAGHTWTLLPRVLSQ